MHFTVVPEPGFLWLWPEGVWLQLPACGSPHCSRLGEAHADMLGGLQLAREEPGCCPGINEAGGTEQPGTAPVAVPPASRFGNQCSRCCFQGEPSAWDCFGARGHKQPSASGLGLRWLCISGRAGSPRHPRGLVLALAGAVALSAH